MLVLGVAFLLGLTVLLQPFARFIKVPHSVVLAGTGLALSAAAHVIPIPSEFGTGLYDQFYEGVTAITEFSLTGEMILFVFLPALVFESALHLELKWLRRDLPVIIFLAIGGVLISAAIVGLTLQAFSGQALLVCLLIGAIIAATDPVAVIALFKDLGAPKRLTVLVEGESLFNDATAIVLSGLVLQLLAMAAQPTLSGAIFDAIRVFGLGVIIGLSIARGGIALMRGFHENAIAITTLAIVTPFFAFVLAEHFFHASGVIAAVMCGLIVGNFGRRVIPPEIFEDISHTWHNISYWATGLIFLLVGMTVPSLISGNIWNYFDEALWLFVVATIVRFAVIFAAMPVLSYTGLTQRLSTGFQVIMVWGGLRGAVSLALALLVLDAEAIPHETRSYIAELVTIFVLFTLALQATSIGALMNWLGLRGLSVAEQTIRDRSVSFVRQRVGDELTDDLADEGKNPDEYKEILERYQPQKASSANTISADTNDDARDKTASTDAAPSHADWVRRGLLLALSQERQFYLDAFDEGAASAERRIIILDRIDTVMDALSALSCKGDDLREISFVLEQSVRHTNAFGRALWLYRTTRLTWPMAQILTWRFNGLTAIRAALHRLEEEDRLEEITAILPAQTHSDFQKLYQLRKTAVEKAFHALWRQHPKFSRAVERYNLRSKGLKLERRGYAQLLDHGLIGPEAYKAVLESLDDIDEPKPVLELHYDRVALLGNLPVFNKLPKRGQRYLASRLKHVFLPPTDVVFHAGDFADSMYFISDGAITLTFQDGRVIHLGTGDFFGEIALLNASVRIATATSDGYSSLMRLDKKDFDRAMAKYPILAKEIEKVAEERQALSSKSTFLS